MAPEDASDLPAAGAGPAERHAGAAAAGARHGLADFQLPEETAALIREAVPENTALAYQSRWRSFEAWCRDAGRVALPATPQTVAAYLTHLVVGRHLKAATADAHLTAVRAVHRGAGAAVPDTLAARKVVTAAAKREAARDGRYGPRKAVPLMAADLPAAVAACDPGTAAGLRDRAVILLGFALLARRAELAALNVSDVEHVRGEGLAVTIRASKTDQSARGVTRRVHYASAGALCPVRAVLAWLDYLAAHGHAAGPLFTRVDRWGNLAAGAGGRYRPAPAAGPPGNALSAHDGGRPPAGRDGRLRPQAIGDIVTAACQAAGLAVPGAGRGMPQGGQGTAPSGERRRYSGHSLRRGGATSMLKAGAQPLNVSRHGRWADGSRAFAGYVEEAAGFGDANPTRNLLLPGRGSPSGAPPPVRGGCPPCLPGPGWRAPPGRMAQRLPAAWTPQRRGLRPWGGQMPENGRNGTTQAGVPADHGGLTAWIIPARIFRRAAASPPRDADPLPGDGPAGLRRDGSRAAGMTAASVPVRSAGRRRERTCALVRGRNSGSLPQPHAWKPSQRSPASGTAATADQRGPSPSRRLPARTAPRLQVPAVLQRRGRQLQRHRDRHPPGNGHGT